MARPLTVLIGNPVLTALQELPAVMAESMESMMPIMRKSIDRMTERTQRQIAEMMKDSAKKTEEGAAPAKN